jgi:hypothetical protein
LFIAHTFGRVEKAGIQPNNLQKITISFSHVLEQARLTQVMARLQAAAVRAGS